MSARLVFFFRVSVHTVLCHLIRSFLKPTASAQAHLRRPRMGLQTFAMRQGGRNPAQGLGAGFTDLDQAAALLEVVDTERL
jgi:hypothetical protein